MDLFWWLLSVELELVCFASPYKLLVVVRQKSQKATTYSVSPTQRANPYSKPDSRLFCPCNFPAHRAESVGRQFITAQSRNTNLPRDIKNFRLEFSCEQRNSFLAWNFEGMVFLDEKCMIINKMHVSDASEVLNILLKLS